MVGNIATWPGGIAKWGMPDIAIWLYLSAVQRGGQQAGARSRAGPARARRPVTAPHAREGRAKWRRRDSHMGDAGYSQMAISIGRSATVARAGGRSRGGPSRGGR